MAETTATTGRARSPYMNPYLAGFGIGVVLLATFVILGRGLGASGAASGGDFEANKNMLVGEKGPEMVRFGAPGSITPADQTARALAATGAGGGGGTTVNVAPAQVKLSVVNVDSPDAARNAMDTAEGGKVIMNQIRANREAVRRELG